VFELSAGQIVADKYRIDAIVGTGGMGVVAAATHVELDQKVAIKFLRDASPEALARFHREARLLVKLKSQNVARVFDVGALDDDTPYIVMELLEGEDLGAALKTRGRLPVEEAVDYVLMATCAVAEAHTMGMIHRDLKPANLFLARGPGGTTLVKVLDFGVSKVVEQDRPSDMSRPGDLTNEGVALGSPGYMSPEQMTSSRDVDARSDVFSLGAILYRLVSGDAPYKGHSVVSVLANMAIEPMRPLDEVAPVPRQLAEVVERALAQDREQRWPSVAHFARALAPFASRRGRQSVDQILATMHVAPDGPLGETRVRPLSFPPVVGATLPLGSLGQPALGAPAAHKASGARTFAVAAAVVAATLALVIVVALALLRRPPVTPAPQELADPAVTSATVSAPRPIVGSPPPVVTTGAADPSGSVAPPSTPASHGAAPKAGTPTGKPRHGAPPKTSTTSASSGDAPPSPNEVPPSRH
jgi:serine/threonine-protein kinase